MERIYEEERLLEGHESHVGFLAFSGDGGKLVTCSGDRTARIWHVATGDELCCLSGHVGPVVGAAFGPRRGEVTTVSADRTFRTWDLATGRAEQCSGEAKEGRVETRCIQSAVSPDGRQWVLASGPLDLFANLVDLGQPGLVHSLGPNGNGVASVAFDVTGERVVTCSWDSKANVWDAETGRLLTSVGKCVAGFVVAAVSADGSIVATATIETAPIHIWDGTTWEALGKLPGHPGGVTCLAFAPTGPWLLSGGHDGAVRVWNADSRRAVREFLGRWGEVRSVAFSPDGLLVAAGYQEGETALWNNTGG